MLPGVALQEQTEALRGEGICPRSHGKFVLEPRLAGRLPDCRPSRPLQGLEEEEAGAAAPCSQHSLRACFWDADCKYNNAIPLQTYTLPVPRNWELPGEEEEEKVPSRALETLSNGQGSLCLAPPSDGCCLQHGAKPHKWEERIC